MKDTIPGEGGGRVNAFGDSKRLSMALMTAAWILFLSASFAARYSVDVAHAAILGLAFVLAGVLCAAVWGNEREFALLAAFLVAVSLVRIFAILTSGVDLSGDEAHYWEWSRRLDWSYYSKPPGVAYVIRLGTLIFGNTVLGVRAFAAVFSFGAGLFMYALGRRLYNAKVGAWAAGLMQVVPLFALYGVGMTPDTMLIFFWTLALFLFKRAEDAGTPRAWLVLGVAMGLGLLGKLAILFFYIPAVIVLLLSEGGRRQLERPWPYVGFATSLVFLLPVAVWNSRHGWVNLKHEIAHANAAQGLSLSAASFGDFVGSQLAVVTPVVFVLMLYALIRRRKEDAFSFWFSIPIMAGFALKSILGKVQANWALVAYMTGTVAFAAVFVGGFGRLGAKLRRLAVIGIAIAVAATAAGYYPRILGELGVPAKHDPSKRLVGWRELGQEVSRFNRSLEGPRFIFSDQYAIASELAFYVEGQPRTYCANLGRRMNQYDLWPGFESFIGYNAIYVTQGKAGRRLPEAFERMEEHAVVVRDGRGREVKRFKVFLCYGFKGMETGTITLH